MQLLNNSDPGTLLITVQVHFLSKFFGRARLFKRIRYESAGSFTYTF